MVSYLTCCATILLNDLIKDTVIGLFGNIDTTVPEYFKDPEALELNYNQTGQMNIIPFHPKNKEFLEKLNNDTLINSSGIWNATTILGNYDTVFHPFHNTFDIVKDFSFMCSVFMLCSQLTQVFYLSKVLGNATEATLLMLTWALAYIVIVLFYLAGMIFLGMHVWEASWQKVGYELFKYLSSFGDYKEIRCLISSINNNRTILEGTSKFDPINDIPCVFDPNLDIVPSKALFFILFFLLIIVILLNGLISIMTTTLDDDMAAATARQRLNFNRYNMMVYEGNMDFSPNPFNLLKEFISKDTVVRFKNRCLKFYQRMKNLCGRFLKRSSNSEYFTGDVISGSLSRRDVESVSEVSFGQESGVEVGSKFGFR